MKIKELIVPTLVIAIIYIIFGLVLIKVEKKKTMYEQLNNCKYQYNELCYKIGE